MIKTFDLIKKTLKGESIYRILFNWKVYENCQNLEGTIIDLASGKRHEYLNYLKNKNTHIIKADLNPVSKPDIILDLNKKLPFSNEFADYVFLFNALYILKDPQQSLKEIYRILKKEGKLFLTSMFVFHESYEPDDFSRFTSQKLKELLKTAGFSEIKILPIGERFSASVFLIYHFFPRILRIFIYGMALFLDKITSFSKFKKKHPCPIGYFCIAKK